MQFLIFLIVGVATYFLSAYFDFFEKAYLFFHKNEIYELDEFVIVAFCWTLLLLIFTITKTRTLNKQNIEIDGLSENLKEQLKSRDMLQSILAHDLKAPFNSLIGLSDLLLKKIDVLEPEKQEEYIRIARFPFPDFNYDYSTF